jgi:hypothetical protein
LAGGDKGRDAMPGWDSLHLRHLAEYSNRYR